MRVHGLLTTAERRLAVLVFGLALVGSAVHLGRRLDPRVEAWLTEGPAPANGPATAPGGEGAPTAPGALAHPPEAPQPGPGSAAAGAPPGPGASPEEAPSARARIDPNTAGPEALTALPGIGPALAGRIVADRARRGPYRRAEDLLRVPGIGPATLARMRPLLNLP